MLPACTKNIFERFDFDAAKDEHNSCARALLSLKKSASQTVSLCALCSEVAGSCAIKITLYSTSQSTGNMSTDFILPEDISPIPVLKTNIKPRRVKMISDFRSGNVRTDATEENGNQREDVICTYCKGNFSDDVQGEIWVQCVIGEDWCHEECAGAENDTFICNYCLQDKGNIVLDRKICSFLCLKLL